MNLNFLKEGNPACRGPTRPFTRSTHWRASRPDWLGRGAESVGLCAPRRHTPYEGLADGRELALPIEQGAS